MRAVHLHHAGILSSFTPMFAGHLIGPIKPTEFTACIGAMILASISLTILTPVELTIFPSIFSSVKLPIFAAIFPAIGLPILPTINTTVLSPVHPPIFLTKVITGLGNHQSLSAISTTMALLISSTTHGSRTTVERAIAVVQRARPPVIHAHSRIVACTARRSDRRCG